MKKVFVLVVFATMFFMIGCGDGSSSDNKPQQGGDCEMQEGKDLFSCEEKEGAFVVLKCADGKWAEHEKCTADQACNSETGKCEGGEEPKPNENCGNKLPDEGEVCDGDAKECSEIDPSFLGGYASCKADCTGYDTSSCASDGGSNGDGANKSECLKLAECFFACQDYHCTDACIAAHMDASDTFTVLYNCVVNNESSCYPQFTCQECADEYNYCAGGGGSGTSGTASCGEILQCLQGVRDQASAQACFDSGTQESQQTYLLLQDCLKSNGCTTYNCEQCTTEYNTCANS